MGNQKQFSIESLRYWPLTAVIQAIFFKATFKWFHLTLFKQIWKSPSMVKNSICIMNYIHQMHESRNMIRCRNNNVRMAATSKE